MAARSLVEPLPTAAAQPFAPDLAVAYGWPLNSATPRTSELPLTSTRPEPLCMVMAMPVESQPLIDVPAVPDTAVWNVMSPGDSALIRTAAAGAVVTYFQVL